MKKGIGNLSREELVAELLRREAQQIKKPDPPDEKIWETVDKRCPHCGVTKKVTPHFGLKWDRDRKGRIAQPWCRQCRSGERYDLKPRKYRTRNSG